MAAVTVEDLLQPRLRHMTQKRLMVISRGLCRLILTENITILTSCFTLASVLWIALVWWYQTADLFYTGTKCIIGIIFSHYFILFQISFWLDRFWKQVKSIFVRYSFCLSCSVAVRCRLYYCGCSLLLPGLGSASGKMQHFLVCYVIFMSKHTWYVTQI